MSGFRSLPALRLNPAGQDPLPFSFIAERRLDRRMLVEISPDREDFLLNNSTEDIRENLVIKTSTSEHWLYQISLNLPPPLRRRDSRSSRCLSFGTSVTSMSCCPVASGREVPLAELILATAGRPTGAMPRHLDGTQNPEDIISLCKELRLSTRQQLTSPRHLGPTHVLVAYEVRSDTRASRRAAPSKVHEIPINDLAFALNVPNLTCRTEDGVQLRPLPHRRQSSLPRVCIGVPHLHTFPELVVYVHNKDQAELFSRFVPEWIRQIMHPLPCARRLASSSKQGIRKRTFGRALKAIRGLCSFGSTGGASNVDGERLATSKWIEEYLDSKFVGVVCATQKTPGGDEIIVSAVTCLNALRANLLHIGYFCQKLWFELDLTRELLLRTISRLAQV